MKNKIEKYCQMDGISGNEKLIRDELRSIFIKNDSYDIIYDNLGSIATVIPGGKAGTIGIFAHMDEVGLMVNKFNDDGSVGFINVGGISPSNLVNKRVEYKKNEQVITGVILEPYPKNDKLKISDLSINFGFKDVEDINKFGIKIGDYISFRGEFEELLNNNYVTKAADNRIGCAIIEKLFEEFSNVDNHYEIVLGATSQEEIGLKGAATLLNEINKDFDQIIIVDVSPIEHQKEIKLGNGPLIRVAEPRGIYDVAGNKNLKEIAKKSNVKTQDFFSKGKTDGAMMQVTKGGYKVNALCVPALNLHTDSSIFNLEDVEGIIKIIKGYINGY